MPNDTSYTDLNGNFTVEGWVHSATSTTTSVDWDKANITWDSPVDKICKRMSTIEERLGIIAEPDEDLLGKYPALRDAYDHYKLVEKLVNESK